jgi:phosphinothricin acetyltransferase
MKSRAIDAASRNDVLMHVRDATIDDVSEITNIYNEFVPTRTIAWTEQPDTLDERLAWFEHQEANGLPTLVAVDDGVVVGFAAYGSFRDNDKWPGYRFTVEHSVHVRVGCWRRGVGRALMRELIERAEAAGLHAMIGAIDGENHESLAFHESIGFTVVARLPEVGWKFDRWLTLVLVQRTLESRQQQLTAGDRGSEAAEESAKAVEELLVARVRDRREPMEPRIEPR